MRLELYKELYYKELERKEIIHHRTQWSISILIVLFGTSLYCVNKLFEIESISFMMCLLSVLNIIGLLCSTIVLCKSLWAKKFMYLPIPSLIEDYYINDLHNHYKNSSNGIELIELAFETYLISIFIKCTDNNRGINKEKMLDTTIANIIMIISFVFLVGAFIFIFPEISKVEEIHRIQVIEGGE